MDLDMCRGSDQTVFKSYIALSTGCRHFPRWRFWLTALKTVPQVFNLSTYHVDCLNVKDTVLIAVRGNGGGTTSSLH